MFGNSYLKCHKDPHEWRAIEEDFESKWKFPNCFSTISGKHVVSIQCHSNFESLYYNHKKFHSIVFMALVDINYNFIMVDIGDYGRPSDGSVLANSNIGRTIGGESPDG